MQVSHEYIALCEIVVLASTHTHIRILIVYECECIGFTIILYFLVLLELASQLFDV